MKIYRISNLEEYAIFASRTQNAYAAHHQFLQSLLPSVEQGFTFKGFSYTAGQEVEFQADFISSTFPEVNWRERVICPITRLNNRIRASIHIFDLFSNTYESDSMYIMEQTTLQYRYLKEKHSKLIGSEYLGNAVPLGMSDARGIRNEDATMLTFDNESLASVLSFDVFEHIFNYRAAFRECFRVLKSNGTLIFTVPFDVNSDENLERATILENGELHHILPPEYHGDPLSIDGVLCFRYYGWGMLNELKRIGFREAVALIFNSENMGYCTNQIIFYCKK